MRKQNRKTVFFPCYVKEVTHLTCEEPTLYPLVCPPVVRKPAKSASIDADVITVFPQERPRPEFAAMAPTMEQNPVTGVKEPYFPEKTRLSRMFTGSMVIIMMVRH